MIRESLFEDIITIDLRGPGDRSSCMAGSLFIKNMGSVQEVHHSLNICISAHICLRIGDSRVSGGPSHAVAHEINRPLENVLPAVQQFLRLLGE